MELKEVAKLNLTNEQEENVKGLTNEYPYVMYYESFEDYKVPWHWHEEVEFNYIVSGELEVLTTNGTYVFRKNEAFFLNSNVMACMYRKSSTDVTVVYSHLFHPVFLSGHFRSLFHTKYIMPILRNKKMDILEFRGKNETEEKILKKLRQVSVLQKEEDIELQTRNYFSEIWLLLLEIMKKSPQVTHPVNLRDQDRMQSMLSFIHQNYTEKIMLEDIAEAASISERECLRCFRNTIQKSPVEYLMDYRLDMAKKLLHDTELSITDISMEAGFSSNAYFGKVFRERCGMTPKEYRKRKGT